MSVIAILNRLIDGFLFGCGLVIANMVMKAFFHIGICG